MNVITSMQSITLEAAERQQDEIRRIMTERGMDYGPATDAYIRERQGLRVLQLAPYLASNWDPA